MLRPVDIQNKDFEKKLKGYDCDEVDEFLDAVIHDYELLYRENKFLKEKNASLKEGVDRYKLMDVTLKQTINVAQKNADEIRESAKREAESIIERAKIEAQKLSKGIDEEHVRKHQELLSLKTQVDSYKSRVKALSESLINMLGEF